MVGSQGDFCGKSIIMWCRRKKIRVGDAVLVAIKNSSFTDIVKLYLILETKKAPCTCCFMFITNHGELSLLKKSNEQYYWVLDASS